MYLAKEIISSHKFGSAPGGLYLAEDATERMFGKQVSKPCEVIKLARPAVQPAKQHQEIRRAA